MSVMEYLQKNGDLLEQLALFIYLKDGNEMKEEYEAVVGCRLFAQVWTRVFGEDQTEIYRKEAITAIANYVRTNPNASQEALKQEISRQILAFALKIQQ